jgi:hypothetical protein
MAIKRKENQIDKLHWEKATDSHIGRIARFSDIHPTSCVSTDWHYGILTAVIEYTSHDAGSTRYECQHGAHGGDGTEEFEEFVFCEVQRVGWPAAEISP